MRLGIAMVPEGRRVFPLYVGKGQPADGRLHTQRQGRRQREPRYGAGPLPASARTLRQAAGHDERRRAADARDRPRADGQADGFCSSTSPRSASRRSSCRTSPARSSRSIATNRSAFCSSSRIRAWRCASRSGPMRLTTGTRRPFRRLHRAPGRRARQEPLSRRRTLIGGRCASWSSIRTRLPP